MAEARIEQLEPDLAQLLFVGGSQRLAELVGGLGHLGLKLLLAASHPRLGLFTADCRVHDPVETLLGGALAVTQRGEDRPHRHRDRQEYQIRKQGFETYRHGYSHLDRHDLVDHPRAQQLQYPGYYQHLGAN